jgi:hypothetical protein
LTGSNFKLGIYIDRKDSKLNEPPPTESAFCDGFQGFGLYSSGQLRNGSKIGGQKYGEPFRGTIDKDTIGVYVDLVEGRLFFSKNGKVFRTAFQGGTLLNGEVYAACACLAKDESFRLVVP